MRTPNARERAKERAYAVTIAADTLIDILIVATAIASGSLTMLSEAIRTILALTIEYNSLWLLHAIHRDRLTRYQFGTGKVEQLVWVIVGTSLVIGGLWVASSVFATVVGVDPPAAPLGLALAAIINAINFSINVVSYWGMRKAALGDMTGVLGAELNARFASVLISGTLQVSLTIAALAKDPGLVLFFDSFGAILVVFIMIRRGIRMISSALGSLFDRPATAATIDRIRTEIDACMPPDGLLGLRSRTGGDRLFVEVTVNSECFPTIESLNRQIGLIRQAVSGLGTPIDVIVVPRPVSAAQERRQPLSMMSTIDS